MQCEEFNSATRSNCAFRGSTGRARRMTEAALPRRRQHPDRRRKLPVSRTCLGRAVAARTDTQRARPPTAARRIELMDAAIGCNRAGVAERECRRGAACAMFSDIPTIVALLEGMAGLPG
eukprot:1003-Chlamydomonas_euryale.AAC.4